MAALGCSTTAETQSCVFRACYVYPSNRLVTSVLLLKKRELNTGGADKSLARPGRKQATATEDFEFHISHL